MKAVYVAAAVVAFASASLLAQESLVGKYSGRLDKPSPKGGGTSDLTISSVENGIVKGSTRIYMGPCAGEYPLEGKYEHPKLTLNSSQAGGARADCHPALDLTVDGRTLSGTNANGSRVQYSR